MLQPTMSIDECIVSGKWEMTLPQNNHIESNHPMSAVNSASEILQLLHHTTNTNTLVTL